MLLEINLQEHDRCCALSNIGERATRARAFALSLLVCATLSLSLSLRLFSSAGCLSLFLPLSASLFASLFLHLLSLRLSLPPRLSLRLRLSRSASRLDLCVCYLSLRLSLSSFRPRLHWRSQQKSTTTPAVLGARTRYGNTEMCCQLCFSSKHIRCYKFSEAHTVKLMTFAI